MNDVNKKLVKTSKYYGQNKIWLIIFIIFLAIASAILYIFCEGIRWCEYFANLCMSLCTGCVTGLLIWIFGIERKKSLKAKKAIGDKLQEQYEIYQHIKFKPINLKKIELSELVANPTKLKIEIYEQDKPITALSTIAIALDGDFLCDELASEFVKGYRKKIEKTEDELDQLTKIINDTAGILEMVECDNKKLAVEDITLIEKNLKFVGAKFEKCKKIIGKILKKAFSKLNLNEYDLEE